VELTVRYTTLDIRCRHKRYECNGGIDDVIVLLSHHIASPYMYLLASQSSSRWSVCGNVACDVWQYQCCGIDSYEDFSKATNWANTYAVKRNDQSVNVQLKTPVACCKDASRNTTADDDSSQGSGVVVTKFCAEDPTDGNSNWKTVIHYWSIY